MVDTHECTFDAYERTLDAHESATDTGERATDTQEIMPHARECATFIALLISNMDSSQTKVTLYVVPGCPLCASARRWLERHAIEYSERDVANDFGAFRKMYRLTKQRLVPVFEAKGRALVRPGEEDLRKLLLS